MPPEFPTLPDYRLVRKLRMEAVGELYEAVSEIDETDKVLVRLLNASSMTATFRERWEVKIQLTIKLDHPGILRPRAYGQTASGYYVVYNHVPPDQSIAARLERQPRMRGLFSREDLIGFATLDTCHVLDAEKSVDHGDVKPGWGLWMPAKDYLPVGSTVIPLLIKVATAMKTAHENHLVHGDLSPHNIFMSQDQSTVRIADYGLNIYAMRAKSPKVAGEIIIGHPAYMAPERFQGSAPDIRSDLYSLGAVAYLMTTGRPPFGGPNARLFHQQHRYAQASPPHVENPGAVPAPVSDVIMRLLAKDPADRYQTPDDLLYDLERIRNRKAIGTRKKSGGTGGKLKPVLALLVVVAALAGIGYGGWYWYTHGPPGPKPPTPTDERLAQAQELIQAAIKAGDPSSALTSRASALKLAAEVHDDSSETVTESDHQLADQIMASQKVFFPLLHIETYHNGKLVKEGVNVTVKEGRGLIQKLEIPDGGVEYVIDPDYPVIVSVNSSIYTPKEERVESSTPGVYVHQMNLESGLLPKQIAAIEASIQQKEWESVVTQSRDLLKDDLPNSEREQVVGFLGKAEASLPLVRIKLLYNDQDVAAAEVKMEITGEGLLYKTEDGYVVKRRGRPLQVSITGENYEQKQAKVEIDTPGKQDVAITLRSPKVRNLLQSVEAAWTGQEWESAFLRARQVERHEEATPAEKERAQQIKAAAISKLPQLTVQVENDGNRLNGGVELQIQPEDAILDQRPDDHVYLLRRQVPIELVAIPLPELGLERGKLSITPEWEGSRTETVRLRSNRVPNLLLDLRDVAIKLDWEQVFRKSMELMSEREATEAEKAEATELRTKAERFLPLLQVFISSRDGAVGDEKVSARISGDRVLYRSEGKDSTWVLTPRGKYVLKILPVAGTRYEPRDVEITADWQGIKKLPVELRYNAVPEELAKARAYMAEKNYLETYRKASAILTLQPADAEQKETETLLSDATAHLPQLRLRVMHHDQDVTAAVKVALDSDVLATLPDGLRLLVPRTRYTIQVTSADYLPATDTVVATWEGPQDRVINVTTEAENNLSSMLADLAAAMQAQSHEKAVLLARAILQTQPPGSAAAQTARTSLEKAEAALPTLQVVVEHHGRDITEHFQIEVPQEAMVYKGTNPYLLKQNVPSIRIVATPLQADQYGAIQETLRITGAGRQQVKLAAISLAEAREAALRIQVAQQEQQKQWSAVVETYGQILKIPDLDDQPQLQVRLLLARTEEAAGAARWAEAALLARELIQGAGAGSMEQTRGQALLAEAEQNLPLLQVKATYGDEDITARTAQIWEEQKPIYTSTSGLPVLKPGEGYKLSLQPATELDALPEIRTLKADWKGPQALTVTFRCRAVVSALDIAKTQLEKTQWVDAAKAAMQVLDHPRASTTERDQASTYLKQAVTKLPILKVTVRQGDNDVTDQHTISIAQAAIVRQESASSWVVLAGQSIKVNVAPKQAGAYEPATSDVPLTQAGPTEETIQVRTMAAPNLLAQMKTQYAQRNWVGTIESAGKLRRHPEATPEEQQAAEKTLLNAQNQQRGEQIAGKLSQGQQALGSKDPVRARAAAREALALIKPGEAELGVAQKLVGDSYLLEAELFLQDPAKVIAGGAELWNHDQILKQTMKDDPDTSQPWLVCQAKLIQLEEEATAAIQDEAVKQNLLSRLKIMKDLSYVGRVYRSKKTSSIKESICNKDIQNVKDKAQEAKIPVESSFCQELINLILDRIYRPGMF